MVLSARHRWPEGAGFQIHRPNGLTYYTFLHFFNETEIELNGQMQTIAPGACLLYDIGTPQRFGSRVPMRHDWMHLDESAKDLIERFNVPLDTVVYPADTAFITAAVCEIELELYGERKHHEALADATAQMLLIRFARACAGEATAETVNPELRERLYELRATVFSHLERNWSVEQMAAQVHLSASRFFAVYKALFATSPGNDLIRARIDAARSVLTGSNVSITQVAEQLGYANTTHFSRQFRQQTGVSPREYARQRSADHAARQQTDLYPTANRNR